MLLKLCENISKSRFEFRVLNLRGATPFAKRFAELGIPVQHLSMRPALPSLRALWRIRRAINDFQPDILQGWMYHGNFAALTGKAIASHKPVLAWNIRKAVANIQEYRPLTRITLRIGAALSHRAKGVIYCGRYIASQHSALGYCTTNQFVIANGFDTTFFRPSPEAYRALRSALGLAERTPIVGMTARYHPHKDHPTFLRMAALVAAAIPDVHFVLAGRGLDPSNTKLTALASELGISERLHLLGECSNIERLLPAFDVYCLSSIAEGFPNSLGEAMACEVPCVTTDAGASREVVDDTGTIVPVRDATRLADAVTELLSLTAAERKNRGARARERVVRCFSLSAITRAYEEFYADAAMSGSQGWSTTNNSPIEEPSMKEGVQYG
jgi:glycosyltransferase involved in cell wall biosynthesis